MVADGTGSATAASAANAVDAASGQRRDFRGVGRALGLRRRTQRRSGCGGPPGATPVFSSRRSRISRCRCPTTGR